jgi:hypothetical protein
MVPEILPKLPQKTAHLVLLLDMTYYSSTMADGFTWMTY